MKKYQNIKKSTEIGLYISLALMVFCFILRVVSLIRLSSGGSQKGLTHTVISLVIATLIIIYSLWGYKKPHGNLLKYAMLLFGASILLHTQYGGRNTEALFSISVFAGGIAAMMIAYISGRLQKIERNKILMIIVGVILVVLAARRIINTGSDNILRSIGYVSSPIYWITLCYAYVARYEEHKEAGLIDAVRKQQEIK